MTEKVDDLIAELRGFAEGSESARATLMRDAADTLERYAALNDVFLDMRDRVGDYSSAPPASNHFQKGASAFEWAATSVRRVGDNEPTPIPPIPISRLREGEPTEDRYRYYVLTCETCGDRFTCAARARVEHFTYPDDPERVYHNGRPIPKETPA